MNRNNEYNALIEEYKSLRTEMMRAQNARLLTLGFTITAIGTILGLTLRGNYLNYNTSAFLISFAILITIAALVLTIHLTQQMDSLGGYIRKFIEPKTGLCWETRWMRYRESKKSNQKAGLPLGMSKALAKYYGLLTISISLMTSVTGIYANNLPAFVFILVLTISSLLYSCDLYWRWAGGWRMNWDELDDKP
jgi:uncharacterized membrane protein AbrB (regulator of aidB expression)